MALNLGTIIFGLEANTQGLARAVNNVQNFGNRVTQIVKTQQDGIDAATRALIRQEASMVRGLQTVQNKISQINRLNIDPKVKTDSIQALERAYADLAKRMNTRGDRPLNPLAFQRAQLGFTEQLQSINRLLDTEKEKAKQAGSATADAFIKQEVAAIRAAGQVQKLVDQIQRATQSGGLKAPDSSGLLRQAEQLQARVSQVYAQGANPLDSRAMAAASVGIQRHLSMIRDEFKQTQRASNPLINTFRGIGSAIELNAGPLNGFVFRIRAATELMSRHGLVIGGVVAALAGLSAAFLGVGSAVLRAGMDIERTSVMLKAISGSSIQAGQDLEFVRRVSDQAGLSFVQTARDFARYSASAAAAGVSNDNIRKQFTQIAMAAGTMQLSVDDTRGVFRALEQIMSKGTVQSEELRGQLADRFPAAFTIAAKAVGKTTRELGEMMKKGDVISREFVPAFLNAMTQFYHIDISKPIDTLAASINRLQNAWTFFLNSIAQATGAMNVAKGVVNGLATTLNYLGRNMDTIIKAFGALAGALAGLAAMYALPAVASAILAAFSALGMVVTALTSGMAGLAAANLALAAAFAATPWGLVITLALRLAAAVGGAVLGYNLMSQAVARNHAAMGNTSSIMQYINLQKQLGYQIGDTTQELIKQQQAMLIADQKAADDATRRAQAAQRRTKIFTQDLLGRPAKQDPTVKVAPGGKLGDFFRSRAEEAAKTAKELQDQIAARKKAIEGLKEVAKLPEQKDSPIEAIAGKDAKAKLSEQERALNSFLRRLKDYGEEAKNIGEQLTYLKQGGDPRELFNITALADARRAFNDLDEQGISQVVAKLKELGFVAATPERALADFFATIDRGRQSVEELSRVMEDFLQYSRDLEQTRTILQNIAQGASLEDILDLEYAYKADEALRRLSQDQMVALGQQLDQLGVVGDSTAAKWQNLLKAIDRNQEAIDQWKAALEDNKRAWIDWSHGVVDAIEGVLTGSMSLKEGLTSILKDLAATILRTQLFDPIKRSLTNTITSVMEQRKSAGTGPQDIQGLGGAIGGGAYVMGGVGQVFKGLFGQNPLQDTAKGITDLTSASQAAALAIGRDLENNAITAGLALIQQKGSQMANAIGLNQATTALLTFTQALYQSIAAMSSGGATGGGLFGKILKGTIGLATGGGYGIVAGGFEGTALGGATDFMDTLGRFSGRAAGGPMTRGHIYRVGEKGGSGDLFIPGQSGWAVPGSHLTSQERSVTIDASVKYIDARGATPDAIAALEARLREREQRMMTELPLMIDNRVADSSRRRRV